jgi:hypothetical protein
MASRLDSKVSRSVLLRRFSEFSTAGSFILLCLQDKSTGKKSHIVLENDEWYFCTQKMLNLSYSSTNEYTQYMVEHATDCFPVPADTFRELNQLFNAPEREDYIQDSRKGAQFFRDKYLERVPWFSGLAIREQKDANDRSFLRVLLELGFIVRRDCESGRRYVEEIEGDPGQ